jgi:ZIP family zinc transporter
MYDWFASLHPVYQALLAGLFTWFITATGAACVFITRHVNRRLLDGMLGFSGGVMLAASYWSLIAVNEAMHTASKEKCKTPKSLRSLTRSQTCWNCWARIRSGFERIGAQP